VVRSFTSSRRAKWRSVCAISLFALAAAACGSGSSGGTSAATSGGASPKASKHFLIDFANGEESSSSYIDLQKTLVSTMKQTEPNVTLHVFNNNYNSSTTFENLSTMISEHPDVIVEYNPLASATTRISEQLKRSGIPCVAPNVPIPGCAFFNEDLPPMGKQLAVAMTAMMKQRGWTGSNTEVVLVEIASVGALNSALWDFYDPLSHAVPGMTPVSASSITTTSSKIGNDGLQVNPVYSQSAGYSEFSSLLQTIPSSKHIVVDCLGDDTCSGAYRALQQAHRQNDAMLASWGAGPQAINLIKSGSTWVAESANFFANWGEFLAPMAVAIAQGQKPPAQTYPPMAIVTKSNVGSMFNASGSPIHFPALPAGDQYLLSTGILQKLHNVAGVPSG
jgi:ribose transport system substrate-binding protein